MKVAIIGAGVAGIAAMRHLAERPEISHVVAYEQNSELGGTWVYTDQVGEDDRGLPIHTSMYKDLWSNLPWELMKYQDLDYPGNPIPESFRTQRQVLQYLNRYVDLYNLRQYIKRKQLGRVQWRVDVRCLSEPQRPLVTETFDAIFVCNGTCSVPLMPDLPGLDIFRGHVIHSHDYRTADPFAGKTVISFGGGFSGIDLSMNIERQAKQVYLSHRNPLLTPESVFPDGVKQVPCIKEVRERAVVLEDGQELDVDAIVLCTGYRYSFPFLADVCRPKDDSGRLTPLYKHVVHVEHPTLYFIGMVKLTLQFQISAFQVQLAVAFLLKLIPLPSREVMLKDIEDDYRWRLSLGFTPSKAHHLFPCYLTVKPYQDAILQLANGCDVIKPIDEGLMQQFEGLAERVIARPLYFREHAHPENTKCNCV